MILLLTFAIQNDALQRIQDVSFPTNALPALLRATQDDSSSNEADDEADLEDNILMYEAQHGGRARGGGKSSDAAVLPANSATGSVSDEESSVSSASTGPFGELDTDQKATTSDTASPSASGLDSATVRKFFCQTVLVDDDRFDNSQKKNQNGLSL